MKLVSSILLTFALSADAFDIQTPKQSSSTTSLNEIGLQWGYDERGYKKEYYLEPWCERNKDLPQNKWAYDPWSGISQTLHGSTEGDIYNSQSPGMNAQGPSPPPIKQQAASFPPKLGYDVVPFPLGDINKSKSPEVDAQGPSPPPIKQQGACFPPKLGYDVVPFPLGDINKSKSPEKNAQAPPKPPIKQQGACFPPKLGYDVVPFPLGDINKSMPAPKAAAPNEADQTFSFLPPKF